MYAVVIKGSKRHKGIIKGLIKGFSPGYSTKKEADKVLRKSKSPERLIIIEGV